MGVHYTSVYGTVYDSDEPLYFTTEQGDFVWDRVMGRWLAWEGLDAKATAEGHTWQPREVGIPSIRYQLNNRGGFRYAPGLDDTSGLLSEIVVNGDVWTGAPVGSSSNTPPDSWTAENAGTTFQNFSGILDIRPDPILGGGMSQTLTGTPGTYYVVEVIYTLDQTAGVAICLNGICLPLGGVPEGDNSEITAFSFQMPAGGTVDLSITVAPGSNSAVDHVRCFEESELTGNPGTGGTSAPTPIPNPIQGPYMAGDTTFWINTDNCCIGFDVDSDPAADIWMTGQEVCDSEIDAIGKMGIHAQLEAHGCPGLPCMRKDGTLKAAYVQSDEEGE